MDLQQEIQLACLESDVIRLLSMCMLRPTYDLAKRIQDGSLVEGLKAVFEDCDDEGINTAIGILEHMTAVNREKSVDEIRLMLEVEYNRLFVGPQKVLAPPYESVHRKDVPGIRRGLVRGTAEDRVLKWYHHYGVSMPEKFVELPDHIGIELEFVAILAAMEAEALENGDQDGAFKLHMSQQAFCEQHLSKWFDSFAAAVTSSANLEFYPSIIVLIKFFVLAE